MLKGLKGERLKVESKMTHNTPRGNTNDTKDTTGHK